MHRKDLDSTLSKPQALRKWLDAGNVGRPATEKEIQDMKDRFKMMKRLSHDGFMVFLNNTRSTFPNHSTDERWRQDIIAGREGPVMTRDRFARLYK